MVRPRKGRPRKRRAVSLPQMNGDHGPNTELATRDTVVEKIEGPNNMARRVRINQIRQMEKQGKLTMRQIQAADAIQEAHCRLEAMSSGGALKERVDASPKPDAIIASQVDAQSRWIFVTERIPRADRAIVEAVCCHNKPLRVAHGPRQLERFRNAMDRVADHLRY